MILRFFFLIWLSLITNSGRVLSQIIMKNSNTKASPKVWSHPVDDWHLKAFSTDSVYGLEVNLAYDFLEGKEKKKKVIVAVIDTGCDIEHEDLKENIWRNKREVANNGIDDDGNGYVDDVHGWNFLGKADGTVINNGIPEEIRLFVKYKDRYEFLHGKRRSKKEEKEFIFLHSIIKESDIGRTFNLLLESKNQGVDRDDMESDFYERLSKVHDDREWIGDDLKNIKDRYYGNSILFSEKVNPIALAHGTHVAGIIGSVRGNGKGIDGVADNVELMIIRIMGNGDEYDKDVAAAIYYAVENGADIINMSFCKKFSPQIRMVEKAFRFAEKKGVLMVHAAGNDFSDIDEIDIYPRGTIKGKFISTFINVGATDVQGNLSRLTNYGKRNVDVFAPGVNIFSTIPGNDYQKKEGTSMAAPMVSGVAAILMTYFPELSAKQVKQIIIRTAITNKGAMVSKPSGPMARVSADKFSLNDLCVSGGIVNAYEAVKMAEKIISSK